MIILGKENILRSFLLYTGNISDHVAQCLKVTEILFSPKFHFAVNIWLDLKKKSFNYCSCILDGFIWPIVLFIHVDFKQVYVSYYTVFHFINTFAF